LPERALDLERRTGTQAAKDLFAELPARRAAHMQLEQRGIVRRIGEREDAGALARQHDVDVLPALARLRAGATTVP
jgi:hypothetical protein